MGGNQMRKRISKICAVASTVLMLSMLPGMQVLASEVSETVVETTTESTESIETEESTIISSESTNASELILNYLYAEETTVLQGNEQTLVVSVEGIQEQLVDITDIRMGYSVNGTEEQIVYTEVVDDLILFRQKCQVAGTYEILYCEITKGETVERFTFADYDIMLEYQVEEVTIDVEPLLVEEETPIAVTGETLTENVMGITPQTATADGKVVIVIDPGHDSVHCGAAGNGLREEVLTLKIAQYCKEELEQYRNVEVYMTREDGSCLYPSSNGTCMKERCNYAASVNADLLISIHIDAGSLTATGAMVIVAKNDNYRNDLSTVTHGVGEDILEELNAIGLASRGLYVRMSDSVGEEYQYPNGAVADWYSITRNSIKVGVPGIIVEHGFISNPSDVAKYLSSDEKLKALGVADATGIAEYFGLSKEISIIDAMIDDSQEPYTDDAENVSGFIANLYHSILGRTPSKKEVSIWASRVATEHLTGSELVVRFLRSSEFQSKLLSDQEYIEKLYQVFLGRVPENEGMSYWTKMLESGVSREDVAYMIGNSPEFERVCARYGVAQGNSELQYVKLYPQVAEFVTTYYQGLLGRNPEAEGLEYWTEKLVKGGTASDLTKGFIYSPEFCNRNLSKDEFVESLYITYLGRASEPSGKTYWTNKLTTMSVSERINVISGFVYSSEYKEYCERYGIKVGEL